MSSFFVQIRSFKRSLKQCAEIFFKEIDIFQFLICSDFIVLFHKIINKTRLTKKIRNFPTLFGDNDGKFGKIVN